MSRKIKAPTKELEERTVDNAVEENGLKKTREPKRNDKLTKEMMYGQKAYKRNVRETMEERDRRFAELHSFGGQGRVVMAWDLNEQGIKDQIFMIQIDDKKAYLSAIEIQKYLRWVQTWYNQLNLRKKEIKMDTIKIDDKEYEVISRDETGFPTIKGEAISTQDGFDKDGNPKISVKIKVPAANILAMPGENG